MDRHPTVLSIKEFFSSWLAFDTTFPVVIETPANQK
jgi:hypothetical protein